MEFPISGKISIGAYHATSVEDLIALYEHIKKVHGEDYSDELAALYPDVFEQGYTLTITQTQLDMLHLLLGHVSSREAFDFDRMISDFVSPEAFENYERVTWSANSEDGLNIKID